MFDDRISAVLAQSKLDPVVAETHGPQTGQPAAVARALVRAGGRHLDDAEPSRAKPLTEGRDWVGHGVGPWRSNAHDEHVW